MTDRLMGPAPLFLYPFIHDKTDKNKKTRQLPTLPLSNLSSTIGTKGLNFRVRNGNGCFPFVMIAGI
jgi:hypothetical protein